MRYTLGFVRFWQIDSYETRFAEEEPQYFDKEFLRLWFKENCDPYKDATLPEAPPELVEELNVGIFRCMANHRKEIYTRRDPSHSFASSVI